MAIEWNEEFIRRRMEEHRRMQQEAAHKLFVEIIEEAQALPRRKPRTADLFEDELFSVVPKDQGRSPCNELRP